MGSLERRIRNCMVGVRAEPFADDALDLVELELYLGARAIPNPRLEGVECLWRNAPLGAPSFEILKPRNLRSSGRATALFVSLTVSRSLVRNRLTEAMTRSPAR
jgi:hypothetical protein